MINQETKHEAKRDVKFWTRILFKPLMNQRGAVGDPPADPPADPPSGDLDDVSTIFTADEVKERKDTLTTLKTETERRAKLTPEELKTEDDARAVEAQKKADDEAAGKVPEKYSDFKIPDGMEMDTALLAEADPIFKELNLTQAGAQKMIDLFSEKIMPAFVKRQTEAWEQQKKDWYAETIANKEIKLDDKGANLDGNRVINTLFSKEEAPKFKAELVKYGLDNHPWLNLLLTRAAKHLKEDTIDPPKGGINDDKPASSVEEMADRLYPDKK